MSTQWDGVPFVFPSTPCDLCRSQENVERKQEKIPSSSWVKIDRPYRQSNLCEKCKSEGWVVFLADIDRVSYYNTKTREFKYIG